MVLLEEIIIRSKQARQMLVKHLNEANTNVTRLCYFCLDIGLISKKEVALIHQAKRSTTSISIYEDQIYRLGPRTTCVGYVGRIKK
jgi:hypothetical protein